MVYAKAENKVDLSETNIKKVEDFIESKMKKAKIPGMSVAIVKDDKISYINGFGYADIDNNVSVTPDTLFEIASCSKSYTALAVLQLRDNGMIGLDDPVSKYFPWFHVAYKGKSYEITIRQLLHHTSGIPDTTISLIPPSTGEDALEQVVRNVSGIKLDSVPGTEYEYATINYDILGAIIEKVTGRAFDDYMQKNVFTPLSLNNTTVYPQSSNHNMAKGYKLSFFHPQEYDSPIFKGNVPAGYVISNARDTARWLMLQLGTVPSDFTRLFKETQIPDRTVEPRWLDRSSYAMGWAYYQIGSGELAKAGMNPSFSAYMTFRAEDKIGVGVLSNFNSEYTFEIGKGIIDIIQGKEPDSFYRPEEGLTSWDTPSSLIAMIVLILLLATLIYFGFIIFECFRRKRRLKHFEFKDISVLMLTLLVVGVFAYGLYVFPRSIGYNWTTAIVWLPQSFEVAVISLVAFIVLGYICYITAHFLQRKDSNMNQLPQFIVFSFLSGIGNYVVIALVNNQINNDKNVGYKLFYFILALSIYIFGRKFIETGLIKITNHIIYDKRMTLLKYIFSTPYKQYEKLDNGRILATLNYDTETVGNSASVIVTFITYSITIVCCFIYLGIISPLGMILTLGIAFIIATLYAIATQRVDIYWERARNTQDIFMKHIDSLLSGFKELSMHKNKKDEFRADVDDSCAEYRDTRNIARLKFLNVYLTGESMLILVLGAIVFLFPNIFKSAYDADTQFNYTLAKFVITFLYIIGPVNGLLGAFPQIMQIKVSWKRIKDFIKEIPQNRLEDDTELNSMVRKNNDVNYISIENISFVYDKEDENLDKSFSIGPVSFELGKGEIMFITGGNGSGKTTLAKIITGLYEPSQGSISVNGRVVRQNELSELFSTVFSDFYLFEKLYDINTENKQKLIKRYLKLLELEDKVEIKDGRFTTTKLSSGQRKRLALLVCMLEDRPIILLDEWAADQDPQFRKFFYRNLLTEMKANGKIIIAITHDDHYFNTADKILKLDEGRIDEININSNNYQEGYYV